MVIQNLEEGWNKNWISVGIALPPFDEDVLVIDAEAGETAIKMGFRPRNAGGDWCVYELHGAEGEYCEITFWMPLPEPPTPLTLSKFEV
jgi:hypothetical protein